jgi:hypothetical protein
MDNSVTAYTLETDSSEESDSSDSSNEGNLLSNNLGVLNRKFEIKDERFLNQEKVEDYQRNRDSLFTRDIDTVDIIVDSYGKSNKNNYVFDLKTTYKNVIDIGLIRSIIQQKDTGNNYGLIDVIVPEIPYLSCIQNNNRTHIIDRVPTNTTNKYIIQHEPIHLSYKKGYFFPITLDKLSILLQVSGTSPTPTEYDTTNENSFIFRLTILKNLDLMK